MRKGFALGGSILAIAVAAPAFAQTAPPPPAATPPGPSVADDSATSGDDIIVTAGKRAQTLQDTPIAVSVTSAETIEQAQIRDLIDLQSVVPSLRISQNQSSGQTSFFIRGFGNGANNPGIEPSVGVFVDGVYRSRTVASIGDFPNIERIEVLRGPQSTLFGKNASAGVISVVTEAPKYEFGGSVSATYGNFDTVVLKGDVTGPLVGETVAFSLAGNYNKRDGFVDVVNLDRKINSRDRWDVRGQLLIEPSSDLSIRIIGDYGKINDVCCAGRAFAIVPALESAISYVAQQPATNFNGGLEDEVRLSQLPLNDIENYGISGQIDYDFGGLTLTSITAYHELRSLTVEDSDYTAADLITSRLNTDIDTFTQEVRLTSDFDGPLNFLIGGYYFKEKIDYVNALTFGVDTRDYLNLISGGTPIGGGAVAGGGLATAEGILTLVGRPPAAPFFRAGPAITDQFDYDNKSYSIFGTVDFEPFEKLTLTAGFNYTKDKKKVVSNVVSFEPFSAVDLVELGRLIGVPAAAANTPANPLLALRGLQFLPPFLNFPNAVEDGKTDDSDWSYTLRAAYKFNRNWNAYVTYATGFKASSYNLSRDSRPFARDFIPGSAFQVPAPGASPIRTAGLALPNLTTGTRFARPEQSDVLEAGIKASFDRVNFNIAVFDQSIRNFQGNVFTGTGFVLTNAGKQSTRGVEFEGSVTPVDPLTFFISLSYLDAQFDEYVASPFGDLSGFEVAGIAPINVSMGANFTHQFAGGQRLTLRADYFYASDVQTTQGLLGGRPTNAVRLAAARPFRREVDELNASATIEIMKGLELSGYVRNLLNDRYISPGVFDGVAQDGSIYGYANQPRTYGASVRFKF